ncbi:hypothetical protein ACWF0M_05180 [Kribbella sp. NPDC055110]
MRIWTGAAVTVVALSLTGCGAAKDDPQVATAGGSPTASSTAASGGDEPLVKFSQCMRANGVPNYPDPKEGANGGVDLSVPEGTDPKAVEAATAKCKSFLPGGGEVKKPDAKGLEELRKLAQCMRANGVSKFPDPSADGQQVDPTTLGIDPMSPEFQAAQKKCQPAGASTGPQNGSNG